MAQAQVQAQLSRKQAVKYNIEMDRKAILIFFTLLIATGSTLFYLGILAGKATRDPNEFTPPVASISTPNPSLPKEEIPLDELVVFNLKDQPDSYQNIKKLRNDFDSLSRKTDTLEKISTASRKTPSEKVATTTSPKLQELPNVVLNNLPNPGLTEKKSYFTVQIFATSNRQKAENLVKSLKKQNFPVYFMESPRAGGTPIYRVRVGKVSEKEAKNLKTRLSKAVQGLGGLKIYSVKE